jgi:hypothetical protein
MLGGQRRTDLGYGIGCALAQRCEAPMLAMTIIAILCRAEKQRISSFATVPNLPLVFARRKMRGNPGLPMPVKELRIDLNTAGLRVKAADDFRAVVMGERVLLLTSVDVAFDPGRGLSQFFDGKPDRFQHVVPACFKASIEEFVGHAEPASKIEDNFIIGL